MAEPCPNRGQPVEFDQVGASPTVIGTAHERKRCPRCGKALIRQTDPIPAKFWRLDEAAEES